MHRSLMHFCHRGSRRDTSKLRTLSQHQRQLSRGERSSHTQLENCPNICNLTAARIPPSASHPTHRQCGRRKNKPVGALTNTREENQRNPFHCTETPGLPTSGTQRPLLPLPSKTTTREMAEETFREGCQSDSNFKELLFDQQHSLSKTRH